MAYEVMVTLSAEVCDVDVVSAAAREMVDAHRELVEDQRGDGNIAFLRLLEALEDGKAFFGGNKGDVMLWGGVFNYFTTGVDEFTDLFAAFMKATAREWLTNAILSWEPEQQRQREERVIWVREHRLQRKGEVTILVADVPTRGTLSVAPRWPWGTGAEEGPPGRLILRVDGEAVPHVDSCTSCRRYVDKFHWEAGFRRCPNCGDERSYVDARTWRPGE